jgi:sugar phosphate isomerase/epimerase
MLRCFEEVGTGNLYVNLDTANLILYGKANPVDALDVFGKYVRNLHAKDGFYPTNGHELGAECRLGDGKVDFKGVLTKLHELGFDRYITIEREISGEQQAKDIE